MNTQRIFLAFAAASGALAVMLGAFGAHALKSRLPVEQLFVFETGVRYQMYHAFALIAVAWLMDKFPGRCIAAAGWLFMAGIVLFSGSLYGLSLASWKWLGPVTPLGGLLFISGWFTLLAAILKSR